MLWFYTVLAEIPLAPEHLCAQSNSEGWVAHTTTYNPVCLGTSRRVMTMAFHGLGSTAGTINFCAS